MSNTRPGQGAARRGRALARRALKRLLRPLVLQRGRALQAEASELREQVAGLQSRLDQLTGLVGQLSREAKEDLQP